MRGTIVCDITDRAEGRSAAGFASALGARLDLRLVIVYVVQGVLPAAYASLTGIRRDERAEQALEAIAQDLPADAETRVVRGNRAEALARVAAEEGADVIVVGSRSVGFGGRNLRCALARELEAATPVPVFVAPPSTRKRSDRRLSVAADLAAR